MKHIAATLIATLAILAVGHMPPQDAAYIQHHFVGLSPSDITMSAVDLPASGVTTNSAAIDTRGASAITFIASCSQPTLTGFLYANEDGTDSGIGTPTASVTVAPANSVSMFQFSEGSGPTGYNGGSGGTGTIAPSTNAIRLPQRAVKIFFANQGSTEGTCTARAMLAY